MISKILKTTAIFCIRVYRTAISPYHSPTCRFVPTCSKYAEDAIAKYGVVRGGYKSMKRLLRCHPFSSRGGYDPVR
ncbi:MAG: membrane protein insertion efficiency factor YidD [Candidatus Krumholzibacteriota bacterium]|nr:membrane protein insertion efficiency factor YidD [Candidatus Krumholzibacteriota bacterium]